MGFHSSGLNTNFEGFEELEYKKELGTAIPPFGGVRGIDNKDDASSFFLKNQRRWIRTTSNSACLQELKSLLPMPISFLSLYPG